MPRPKKTNPAIAEIVEQFSRRIGVAMEKFVTARVEKETRDLERRSRRGRRGRRPRVTCYFPGCKNVAAPRFGMFCAALHKNLPDAEKRKYHAMAVQAKAAAQPPRAAAKAKGRK